jgi:hypothetical protein
MTDIDAHSVYILAFLATESPYMISTTLMLIVMILVISLPSHGDHCLPHPSSEVSLNAE